MTYLLNGDTTAANVARDSLLEGMRTAPADADAYDGLIPRALRFLAGYGIHVTVATDRRVGRFLDILASRRGHVPQTLVGAFGHGRFQRGSAYCRVGRTANAVRLALAAGAGRPAGPGMRARVRRWAATLPPGSPLTAPVCASIYEEVLAQSDADWRAECGMSARPYTADIPEDWPMTTWRRPADTTADLRGQYLDARRPFPGNPEGALYSDGGLTEEDATYSAQPRLFGPAEAYWSQTLPAEALVAGRMPSFYGCDRCNAHTAELFALLQAMCWRVPGQWQMVVCDRSALFQTMERLASGGTGWSERAACLPIEARLRSLLHDIQAAWCALPADPPKPRWRQHQEAHPSAWNVRREMPERPDRLTWLSRLAYNKHGVVGVDVKSHQRSTAIPHPAVVEGNEVQDRACSDSLRGVQPPGVRLPSGGTFAFLTYRGRMVMSAPRVFVRQLLRDQSAQAALLRPVQGQVVRLVKGIYKPSLALRIYAGFRASTSQLAFLLPRDAPSCVNVAGAAFRTQRAIGGSWTEALHVDGTLDGLATEWAATSGAASSRVCPFCTLGHGTPRHTFNSCPEMQWHADRVRDAIEAALARHVEPAEHRAAASRWRRDAGVPASHRPLPAAEARWPVLSAWRWLVGAPAREAELADEYSESGAAGATAEHAWETGYRGLIPAELGQFLHRNAAGGREDDEEALDVEGHATVADVAGACSDWARASQHRLVAAPVVDVARLLVLGLRWVRTALAQRIEDWRQLATGQWPPCAGASGSPQQLHSEEAARSWRGDSVLAAGQAPRLLVSWAGTPSGAPVVQQLRWAAPSSNVLVARIRAEAGLGARVGSARILGACGAIGLPVWAEDGLNWDGHGMEELRDAFYSRCACAHSTQGRSWSRCPSCLGGRGGPLAAPNEAPCPWCQRPSMAVCEVCLTGIHFRGECGRWLAGAHHVYAAPPGRGLLCPDCWWTWRQQQGCCLLSGAALAGAQLEEELQLLAGPPEVPAGSAAAARAARHTQRNRLRAARRWTSCYLRVRGWVVLARVAAACAAHMQARWSCDAACARGIVAEAHSRLRWEARIWIQGSGPSSRVRWRRGEPRAPPSERHVRAHRRRRRRSSAAAGSEPPRQRRRIT